LYGGINVAGNHWAIKYDDWVYEIGKFYITISVKNEPTKI